MTRYQKTFVGVAILYGTAIALAKDPLPTASAAPTYTLQCTNDGACTVCPTNGPKSACGLVTNARAPDDGKACLIVHKCTTEDPKATPWLVLPVR